MGKINKTGVISKWKWIKIIVAAGSIEIFKSRQTGLNVLGFFQHEASPVTIDELIECVRDASNKLERGTLDNVFTTFL